MLRWIALALAVALAGLPGAARAEDAVGDWVGKVKAPAGFELTITAHIKRGPNGLEGYSESPDQTVAKLPMTDVEATPDTLSFTVPAARGSFRGRWDPAAKGWVGALSQGGLDMPLTLTRGVPPPRPVVAGLDGEWSGVLAVPQGDLRLNLSVTTDAGGTLALFQSPDQSPQKLVARLTRDGEQVKVELLGVGGFEGRLSGDGKAIEGEWRQMGGAFPLTLKKAGG